jgi:hypothetical protein
MMLNPREKVAKPQHNTIVIAGSSVANHNNEELSQVVDIDFLVEIGFGCAEVWLN